MAVTTIQDLIARNYTGDAEEFEKELLLSVQQSMVTPSA